MLFATQLDLTTITNQEKQLLELALGVLRSGSDYADFLGSWLEEYGQQALSPNPHAALLPEDWTEELPEIIDAPTCIQ
jgi:hypothetical protein